MVIEVVRIGREAENPFGKRHQLLAVYFQTPKTRRLNNHRGRSFSVPIRLARIITITLENPKTKGSTISSPSTYSPQAQSEAA